MSLRPVMAAEGVWYRHPGSAALTLRDVSVAVYPGEVVALTGGNGSGKSTLARLLAGDLRPQRGHVVAEPGAAIGIRYQQFEKNLLPWYSAERNLELALGPRGAPGLLEAWMTAVGYDAWREQPVRALSGGQKQLLSVLTTLALRSEGLVLDEPFSAVDPARLPGLWPILREWAADHCVGVLVITHNREEAAAVADRVEAW